jgi:hypothetical protein
MNEPTTDPRSPYLDRALAQLGSAVHEFKRAEASLDYAIKIAKGLARTQEQMREIDLRRERLNRL